MTYLLLRLAVLPFMLLARLAPERFDRWVAGHEPYDL
jgi:hypothetical protein